MEDSGSAALSSSNYRGRRRCAGDVPPKKTHTGVQPYSIAIKFAPNNPKSYTVHIRPAGEAHVLEREAYFTEGDLRETLERCLSSLDAERMMAKAHMTGSCNLRRQKVYLDIAFAAALGWYNAQGL